MICAYYGEREMSEKLLAAGADINAQNDDG